MPTILPGPRVRVVGKTFRPHHFLALVTDPETGVEVEVRYRKGRPRPYRCECCSPTTTPSCKHAFIAHALIVTRERADETTTQEEK